MIKKSLIDVPQIVVFTDFLTLKAREIITRIAEIHLILATKNTIVVRLELLTRKANSAHNYSYPKISLLRSCARRRI